MKKKNKKKLVTRKKYKKKSKNLAILPILFFVALLSLFSETMRTIPVGAKSEMFANFSFEVPQLNSKPIETKYLNNSLSISKKSKYQKLNEGKIIIAKIAETDFSFNEQKTKNQKTILKKDENIVDIPKVEETIKLALDTTKSIIVADTKTSTIVVEGEEKLIPGSSEKNITYMQILQKPNDLDLNLKYAQQQSKVGNFKQTISTLERLNMLYPDNIEIKLYLLSVLVQADSPNKALTIIEEIRSSEDATPEDLETISEIESEMNERLGPKLWNFYADISLGGIQNNNVNSVSKRRLQSSSDSVTGFNSAKYDRTYSGGLGLTATRSIGEGSSFMINASVTDSEQEEETSDDFESYGLTLALDTTLGNQSLSPYFMANKTDYQDDADSFSFMYGIGGYFSVGERNSFSYGYSYSDSKSNKNTTDTTANEANSIGHGFTFGHDFIINEIISTSTGLGYSDSDAKVDAGNDFETYDLSFRLNLAFPWAYISLGDSLSFNDYKRQDTTVNSDLLRHDMANTFDIMIAKSIGDIFPKLDPNKNFFINLSYEKTYSEANIMNYDYIADSISIGLSKSFQMFK